MRGNDFLNKMELIDPAYVEAANTKTVKIKTPFATWGAVAACLCLAVVTAFAMKGAWNMQNEAGSNIPALDTSTTIKHNAGYAETEIVTEPAVDPDTELCTEIFIEPSTGNAAYLPFIPSDGPHDGDDVNITPLIASYGEEKYNIDADTNVNVDMAVSDGGVFLSDSLKAAMEHYGDTVNYRVLVELFDDGVQISSGGQLAIKESERLSELGYSIMLYGEYFGESQNDELVIFNGASTTACEEIGH